MCRAHKPPAAKSSDPRLPRPPTPLFGRDATVGRVTDRLEEGPVVSICGVGGAGKTRLAIRVAERWAERGGDEVAWVELAPLNDPALVASAVSAELEVRAMAGETALDTLAPNAEARFYAVLERLREAPIFLIDPATGEPFPYLYSYLVADALGALYNPGIYPLAANFVAFLESIPEPAALGLARQALQRTGGFVNKRGFPHYRNAAEGFPGVACEDSLSPAGGYAA